MTVEEIRRAEDKLGPVDTQTLRQYRKAHHDAENPPNQELFTKTTAIISRDPEAAAVILSAPM